MTDPFSDPVAARDETRERDLNPHRDDDQRRARTEAIARLRARDVIVNEADDVDAVVNLQEAIEAFEQAVIALGGDLMVDTPPANQPDDPRFVLPERDVGESTVAFAARIRATAKALLRPRAD